MLFTPSQLYLLRCYLHQGQLVTHFSGNTYAKVTVPYKVLLRTPGTNGNYDFHYCHLFWGFEIGWGACWEPHFSTLWCWYRLPGYLLSLHCTLNSSVNPSEIVYACRRLSFHALKLYAGDTTGLQFTSRDPCQATGLKLHFFWPSSKSLSLYDFSMSAGNASTLHQAYVSCTFLSAGQILLSGACVDFTCSSKNLTYHWVQPM